MWARRVIVLFTVETPVEENPIGLIWRFPVSEFLFTVTAVEVPIPTERFDFTFKVILSPDVSSCAVEIETVDTILRATPTIRS